MDYRENLELLKNTLIPKEEQESLIVYDHYEKMVHMETTSYFEGAAWEKLANHPEVQHIPSFHSIRLTVPAKLIRKPRLVIPAKYR